MTTLTPSPSLPIVFDPATGQYITRFTQLVESESRRLADLQGKRPAEVYTESFKTVLDKDSRESGGELSRQHERLTLAMSHPAHLDAYLTDRDERIAAKFALALSEQAETAERFDATEARKISNATHPFIQAAEKLLKVRYQNDPAKLSLAMIEVSKEDPKLYESYILGDQPSIVPPLSNPPTVKTKILN